MAIALVVTTPFAHYVKGDRITEEAQIQAVLADNPHRVVRIVVPDEPAAAAGTGSTH